MNVKEIRRNIYKKNRAAMSDAALRTFESFRNDTYKEHEKIDSALNTRIYEDTQRNVTFSIRSVKWGIMDEIFGVSFFPK